VALTVPTCRRVSPLENLPLEMMTVAFWFVNEIGKKTPPKTEPATFGHECYLAGVVNLAK